MPLHALSERVKKQIIRQTENSRLDDAVNEYTTEQQKPKAERRGLRPIAAKHGVKYKTLHNLVKGGRSLSAFNALKRKLTIAEESVLVDFIIQSADLALPLSVKNIKVHANEILKGRTTPGESVGIQWVGRFLDRHRDKLQTHWSSPLATERAKSLNPEAVKCWFALVKERVVNAGIKPENIYGMDESGFPPSNQGTQRVVGRRGSKIQHKAGSGNRENVTALVTICANGTALNPTIIFKGHNFLAKWGEDNVSYASLSHSENGWTDGQLALTWMKKDFDPQTREKAAGEKRVLLMDGHSSHYTADLLEYCVANNIEVLGYPPHCTHALQGLDVVCFATMKEAWKHEIDQFEELHMRGVNKEDFCGVFGRAFLTAFTPDTIKSAFSATGIHPFNDTVISPEQMKPSEATSTKASFPITQPSPVRATLAAIGNHNFTYQELHPDSPRPTEPFTSPPRTPAIPIDPVLMSTPHSSKRRSDDALQTVPETPSKRMRLFGAALGNTSSGSILVTKAKVTHLQMAQIIKPPVIQQVSDKLDEPDWSLIHEKSSSVSNHTALECRATDLELSLENAFKMVHAQRVIIEAANAQLLIQNLGMIKMNRALHEKEKGKNKDRTVLKLFPDGKGRHLTDPELIQAKRVQEDARKQEQLDKASRKIAKGDRKAEKGRIEAVWKQMQQDHAQAVEEWEANCQALLTSGTRKRDLPRKPKLGLKPKLQKTAAEDEEAGEGDEGSGSDDSDNSDDEDQRS